MKSKNKFNILFVLFIIFFSCNIKKSHLDCIYWSGNIKKECGHYSDKEIFLVTKQFLRDSKDTAFIEKILKLKKGEWRYYNRKGEINSIGEHFPKAYDVVTVEVDTESLQDLIIITKESGKTGIWRNFVDGCLVSKGNYKENLKDGKWLYFKNDEIVYQEFWELGKLKNSKMVYQDGNGAHGAFDKK